METIHIFATDPIVPMAQSLAYIFRKNQSRDVHVHHNAAVLWENDALYQHAAMADLRTRIVVVGADTSTYASDASKALSALRAARKDIFVLAVLAEDSVDFFEQRQYISALHKLKAAGINLVLSRDAVNGRCMVVTPEESRYHVTSDLEVALHGAAEMADSRARARFTRSTVVGGASEIVPWTSSEVPTNLRGVVDWCVEHGAYKPFRGATAGHFAARVGPGEFLTSLRKRDFNRLDETGLVRVVADGDDRVIAYGAKPSVGGQSQRAIFQTHPDVDAIVHFHCPLRPDAPDPISVRPQRGIECGSHQCGWNTSEGLRAHGGIKAVMLDNHGPNIVFGREVPASEVIAFIDRNFDLTQKTGGPVQLLPDFVLDNLTPLTPL